MENFMKKDIKIVTDAKGLSLPKILRGRRLVFASSQCCATGTCDSISPELEHDLSKRKTRVALKR